MANLLSFDFNKIKRTFFDVTLKDGRKLVLKMPMKKTFEKITMLQQIDAEKTDVEDVIETIGSVCAEILSNNMNGWSISAEYFMENYDTEEMRQFIIAYSNFVLGAKNDPN